MTDVSIATIRSMLQARAGELARSLAPGGHERGGVYEAPNPTRGDRKAGSFKIVTSGFKAGSFVDYAGVNAPFAAGGDRGDVIDLIAYVACGRDRKKAIRWARDFLGLSVLPLAEKQQLVARAQAMKATALAREDQEAARRRARVLRLFIESVPLASSPLPAAYFRSRNIDLDSVPGLELGDIRFKASLEWWRGASTDARGVRLPGPCYPAIVCGIRDRTGTVTGVHCTFLAPDGSDKAPVASPKLMYGDVAGSVIRVSRGPSGLTPEEWNVSRVERGLQPDPVIICEGLEDAATLAQACPEARVWAATSLGNLAGVYVDHPCVASIILAGDNDWTKQQAIDQFERAQVALEASGKRLTVMRSAIGKDFNDLARA